jgi:hypothetical protein
MERRSTPSQPLVGPAVESLEKEPELPVVARLVVEIRSDGSRTVARGAMEDASTGMKAAVQAEGRTPLELAMGLAKSLLTAPQFARDIKQMALRRLLKK